MRKFAGLTTRLAAVGAFAVWLVLQPVSAAVAQDTIDPDAASVLEAMSSYLGGLQTFSAEYQADFDVVAQSGQKLKFVASGEVIVQRPDKLHATRAGTIANVDFILDGQVLTIFGRNLNGVVTLLTE